VCPGHLFESLNVSRGRKKDEPFFDVARGEGAIALNPDEVEITIKKVQHFDVRQDIFVIFAHDGSLKGIVDLFPKSANNWQEKGWARDGKWAFLKDFGEALELQSTT
jgi:hypothetical protein